MASDNKREPLKFDIHLTPAGPGSTVSVDGKDLTGHVRNMTLRASRGEPTTLEIEFVNIDVTAIGDEWREVMVGE